MPWEQSLNDEFRHAKVAGFAGGAGDDGGEEAGDVGPRFQSHSECRCVSGRSGQLQPFREGLFTGTRQFSGYR